MLLTALVIVFVSQVAQLHKLVECHTLPAESPDTEPSTDWHSVAKELGRKPLRCQEKWLESAGGEEGVKSS